MDVFEAIEGRRSWSRLVEPAPDKDDILRIVAAAAAAPDHGRLQPWRMVALAGEAKDEFGTVLADAYSRRCHEQGDEPVPAKLEKERTKLGRAPLVIVVVTTPRESAKVPFLEQFAATAAAVQNALLAATALGFGSMWRTGEPTYDPNVKAALGFQPHDVIAGFLYIGTEPDEPIRPRSAAGVPVEDLIELR